MHCEQGSAGTCDGADGPGDGVGDVVQLEVEEDLEALFAEGFDKSIACGVVELHADLEPTAGALKTGYQVEGLLGVANVEGYGQAVLGSCHTAIVGIFGVSMKRIWGSKCED